MTSRLVLLATLAAGAALARETIPLAIGAPVTRELSGTEALEFCVSMQSNLHAGVLLRHGGIDFNASLVTPDGVTAAEFSVPLRRGDQETAEFVADAAGAYCVKVTSAWLQAAGRVEVRLLEIRAATERDRRVYEALKSGTEALRLDRAGARRKALPLAASAAEIFAAELGPRNSTAALWLSTVGDLYNESGEYDRAEPLLREAFEIQTQTLGAENPRTIATMERLGDTYRGAGEYAKAEPLLAGCLDLSVKTLGKDHPTVADHLILLSTLHANRGDLRSAEEELTRAKAIADRALPPGNRTSLHILNNLGMIYNSRHEYTRAEPLLRYVVEASQKSFGSGSMALVLPLWNLALLVQERYKDYPRALELYGRALAILEENAGSDHPDGAAILNNTANIYKSTGDFAKALELHTRVHAMWEKSLGPYHGNTVLSLGNVARTYASMGDVENTVKFQTMTDEALEKNLAFNLAIGSERQKLAYFDSVSERTDRTISYQVKLAPESQAMARVAALAALRRKGRVLDAMSLGLSSLRQRMDPRGQALLDAWDTATSQYARLVLSGPGVLSRVEYQRRIADLAAKRDRAEADVSQRSAELVSHLQPVTLPAVQAAIPPDAALVEYATWRPFDPRLNNNEAYGERRVIAYVLRSQGDVRWKDLGPAAAIDSAVEKFRQALSGPERGDVPSAARALDRAVMEPVRTLAGDATRLLISPEGSLNLAPMQALIDEHGRYLVERYAISYLSSGRDLLRLEVARASHSAPLIVADPQFGDPENAAESYFVPLAGAAQEAAAIHTLFPESRVLAGRDATQSALKRADAPRILHIATHGFFLPQSRASNPLLRSGLALAGANRRGGDAGGVLTALEASGLNLWGTKLVTLSACDTGFGEVKGAEGVFGLRRAFVLAGAESLVMSLWPVGDYVTRETMTSFYSGLKRGLGRGEALRQAQLSMLKRQGREHPFYWAGFIQSGEWASLGGKR
jgi:CHAT domain-containing protein